MLMYCSFGFDSWRERPTDVQLVPETCTLIVTYLLRDLFYLLIAWFN